MLHEATIPSNGYLNGVHTPTYPECASDYDAAPQGETPAQSQPDVQRCAIHNVDMPRRWSKRTQRNYFAHKMADGSLCYSRVKM